MSLFTPTEIEIIQHRLAVDDAIAEVLADDGIESDQTLCVNTAISLSKRLAALCSWERLSELEKEILIETVEGSTYIAGLESDLFSGVSIQKLSSAMRVNTSLAKKLSTLSGRRVNPVNF